MAGHAMAEIRLLLRRKQLRGEKELRG